MVVRAPVRKRDGHGAESSTELGERRLMVLRIGHRIPRDKRVTTHVCLTARALGADGVFVGDVHDGQLVETVNSITNEFGGCFSIETGRPWRRLVSEWKSVGGKIAHLTAYGIPLPRVINEIRGFAGDVLVVVGAEKVPSDLFRLADWNVAVTNQPISEVSALGIFLDWFFDHCHLDGRVFQNARAQIVPSEHGKRLERIN